MRPLSFVLWRGVTPVHVWKWEPITLRRIRSHIYSHLDYPKLMQMWYGALNVDAYELYILSRTFANRIVGNEYIPFIHVPLSWTVRTWFKPESREIQELMTYLTPWQLELEDRSLSWSCIQIWHWTTDDWKITWVWLKCLIELTISQPDQLFYFV